MTWAGIAGATMLAAFFLAPLSARSQQPGETKIPTKIGKIRGGDDAQLAFTGKVKSVDIKLKLLSMTPEDGKNTEIFPIKKNTLIRTVRGDRISPKDLKGTDVMIYYELKGTHRVIKRIIELSPRKGAEEKTPPSPS